MDRRQVDGAMRNSDGEIVGLCGPVFTFRSAHLAIQDIEAGTCEYYVHTDGRESVISVTTINGERRLSTHSETAAGDPLRQLPDG